MNEQETTRFGYVAHTACVRTVRFIESFGPQVEAATAVADDAPEAVGVEPQTIRGYYSRTLAWMRSIERLDQPSDVQAVSVASRALFEGLVDLVLLHFEPQAHPAQMVFDWERSAVFKHAEKVKNFFANQTIPDEYRDFPAHLTGAEAPLIRAARDKWWGGRHPPRWTGRDLGTDAKRAHSLFPEGELTAFYELEYSPTCWGAHGSSMAGLRSTDERLVAGTCAVQLASVQHRALLNTRVILEHLGLYLKVVFDDLNSAIAEFVRQNMPPP